MAQLHNRWKNVYIYKSLANHQSICDASVLGVSTVRTEGTRETLETRKGIRGEHEELGLGSLGTHPVFNSSSGVH